MAWGIYLVCVVALVAFLGSHLADAWVENRLYKGFSSQVANCESEAQQGLLLVHLLFDGVKQTQANGSKTYLRAAVRALADFYRKDGSRQETLARMFADGDFAMLMPVIRKLCPGILPPPVPPATESPAT